MSEYKKEEWRVKQPAADIRALAARVSISPTESVVDLLAIGAYHREPGDHGARCGCVLSE